MRNDAQHLCRYFASVACVLLIVLAASVARGGVQYVVQDRQSSSLTLPGAFAYLSNSSGEAYTANGEDWYGFPMEYTAFAVILDTGASGCLLSATDAEAFGTPYLTNPTTGLREEFTDIGIGGSEDFYISDSITLNIAPMSSDIYFMEIDWETLELTIVDNTEDHSWYSSAGSYNFQVRQNDPTSNSSGYETPVSYNIVGTPTINQHTMHITPNSVVYSSTVPAIDYVQTELLAGMPDLSSTPNVLRVRLTYEDFITETTPVTTSTNPMIEGVQAFLGGNSTAGDWLLDTGAMLTMMGTDMAEDLGIVLGEGYVTTTQVSGVGSETILLYGYQLDSLVLPLIGGDELLFEDIVVYISAAGVLPAELPGILGMNVLGQSYDPDVEFGYLIPTNSAFSDIYIDYASSEMVLVLVPEPGTFVLLAVGGLFLICVQVVRRRR